jgi:hypothetical protein
MELRTNIFDMISAVGGTLGLFTGISVITLVEVIYWSFKVIVAAFSMSKSKFANFGKAIFGNNSGGTSRPTSTKISHVDENATGRGLFVNYNNYGPTEVLSPRSGKVVNI